jgi:hypothetical protein
MNAAAFSSLSADHQRLQVPVAAWRGEEEVSATIAGKTIEGLHIITHIIPVYLCGDRR